MKDKTIDNSEQTNSLSLEWIYEYTTAVGDIELQVYYHKTNNEALIVNALDNKIIHLTEDDVLVLAGILRFYQDKFNTRNKQDAEKYRQKD